MSFTTSWAFTDLSVAAVTYDSPNNVTYSLLFLAGIDNYFMVERLT